MNFIIVIPARMASTRLPNKMMLSLGNLPLIEQTWRQAKKTNAKRIIVATDHSDIFSHMHNCGAEVIMTKTSHQNGTERLSEVAQILKLDDDEIILNWQGDEPFLPFDAIESVVQLLKKTPHAGISTLALPISQSEDLLNPNIVKVVCNHQNFALYFSRAPIPYPRDSSINNQQANLALRHIGVYAYRASFLKQYISLPETPLETVEKLEQLRALYFGHQIIVAKTAKTLPAGIDTAEDLELANKFISTLNPN